LFHISYSLSGNSIDDEGAKAIGKALEKNTMLISLECDSLEARG